MNGEQPAHQRAVHGTVNASTLFEKITRNRIYASVYWAEKCFGLTEETLVDRAVELECVGGTYGGNRKPTDFLCLVLKMLQMKPDPSVVLEFIHQDDHKYARALGAYYWRLTARPVDVYRELDPLLADLRKLRTRVVGGWEMSHVDSFVDALLTSNHCCSVALPTLPPRHALERAEELPPRRSALRDEFDALRRAGKDPGAPPPPSAASRKRGRSGDDDDSGGGGDASKRARPVARDLGEIIEITVNDRLGKKVRVKCHEHDLMLDVKKLVAAQIGTRPEKIRLQKWHSIMKDHIAMSDYEIREGMNLEMYYN